MQEASMKKEDRACYAEWIELLIERPFNNPLEWARTVLMRILERHGECRYRHDDARLKGKRWSQKTLDALKDMFGFFEAADQGLFLRVVLLIPWDTVRRNIGLGLRAVDAVGFLAQNTCEQACQKAVEDILQSGLQAINEYPLDDVLLIERQPGKGHILELSEQDRLRLGLSTRTIEVDRVASAIQNYKTYSWESNLRGLAYWWIKMKSKTVENPPVDWLLSPNGLSNNQKANEFILLGLMDWMTNSPKHLHARIVLKEGLDGKTGAMRKTAAELAFAMGDLETLESMSSEDPDLSVRRKANLLLQTKGSFR
jgi:hypothetical protein